MKLTSRRKLFLFDTLSQIFIAMFVLGLLQLFSIHHEIFFINKYFYLTKIEGIFFLITGATWIVAELIFLIFSKKTIWMYKLKIVFKKNDNQPVTRTQVLLSYSCFILSGIFLFSWIGVAFFLFNAFSIVFARKSLFSLISHNTYINL